MEKEVGTDTQRYNHVETQGKDGHPQTKEETPQEKPTYSATTLLLDFRPPE
jgi:hypothetical protein